MLVSKYEKYFSANNGRTSYMAFVLDDMSQIALIHKNSFQREFRDGVECKWYPSKHLTREKMIHAYMFPVSIARVFDVATGNTLYNGKLNLVPATMDETIRNSDPNAGSDDLLNGIDIES